MSSSQRQPNPSHTSFKHLYICMYQELNGFKGNGCYRIKKNNQINIYHKIQNTYKYHMCNCVKSNPSPIYEYEVSHINNYIKLYLHVQKCHWVEGNQSLIYESECFPHKQLHTCISETAINTNVSKVTKA